MDLRLTNLFSLILKAGIIQVLVFIFDVVWWWYILTKSYNINQQNALFSINLFQ